MKQDGCFLAALFLLLPPPRLLAAAANVKNPDTFIYAMAGDVDSLDPHWEYDGVSHTAVLQIYETLISYRGASASEYEPRLSLRVPAKTNGLVSPDGRRYKFPIRKGVRFHAGQLLTPEDVRYSVLRFLLAGPETGPGVLLRSAILGTHSLRGTDNQPRADLLPAAERAVRVEGDTVILELNKPFAPLLAVMATFCPIVSKEWVVTHGGWDGTSGTWQKHFNPAKQDSYLYDHANGTGPFLLERWDKNTKQVVLIRNDRYWKQPPNLKRIVLRNIPEFSSRRLLLAAGDVDAAFVERPFLPQLQGVDGLRIEDMAPLFEVNNAFIFGLHVDAAGNPYIGSGKLDGKGIPPDFFADPDVRRGFAHAFDYAAYLRDGYKNRGTRSRGPIPLGVWGRNPEQPVSAYDLAQAAAHFRKAFGGQVWDKGFTLTVAYLEGRTDRELACSILKKGLETINPKFKLELRGILWSTYLSHFQAGKIPLVNTRWAMDFPDPHNSVYPFMHSSGRFAKVTGYRNPEADRLLDNAVGETDSKMRLEMYEELQKIAEKDLPAIFTVDTYFLRVSRSWVKGWDYNPVQMYSNFYPLSKRAQ